MNVYPKIVQVNEAVFYSNLTLKLKKKLIRVFKFRKKIQDTAMKGRLQDTVPEL